MKFIRMKKLLHSGAVILILMGIIASAIQPLNIYAEGEPITETVTRSETMILSFSTASVTSSSKNNGIMDVVNVALTYVVYPSSNPGSQQKETILVLNNQSTSFSRTVPVNVTGADGVDYSGTYSFSVNYDSSTSTLKLNGTTVSLGTDILRNANVYPEAYVNPAVVGVEMNPLPFSQVKAYSGMSAGAIDAFNARVNSGITQTINLVTEQFGTGATSTTTLSMFVYKWKRLPDGSYDKSQEATRVQVIYSAADILNGIATNTSWTGTQYYRLVTNTASTGYRTEEIRTQTGTTTVKYYMVANRTGWTYKWGYSGVIGAWSGVYTASVPANTETRIYSPQYKFKRYALTCKQSTWIFPKQITHYSTSPMATGDAACKSRNSGYPKYVSYSSDETGWLAQSSYAGYGISSRGYKYQDRYSSPVWGAAYETRTPATQYEVEMEQKKNVSSFTRQENVYAIKTWYYKDGKVITAANGLSEAGVNEKVTSYAVGLATSDLLGISGMESSAYWAAIPSRTTNFEGLANLNFKEKNNWGLYLYVTGHWRAVEVPISWYEINASTSSPVVLTGIKTNTPSIPSAPPETEISLTDFSYIQSVYNKVKSDFPTLTQSALNDKFILVLSTDKNKAAIKVMNYYNSLIESGKSKSQAFELVNKDFNLNLEY